MVPIFAVPRIPPPPCCFLPYPPPPSPPLQETAPPLALRPIAAPSAAFSSSSLAIVSPIVSATNLCNDSTETKKGRARTRSSNPNPTSSSLLRKTHQGKSRPSRHQPPLIVQVDAGNQSLLLFSDQSSHLSSCSTGDSGLDTSALECLSIHSYSNSPRPTVASRIYLPPSRPP